MQATTLKNRKACGAKIDSINKGENRLLFRDAMKRICIKYWPSAISENINEFEKVAEENGSYSFIIRPAYNLGGTGGGIAHNREEYL